jgi:cytochrome o ubiquinol oxidase subunit IV
MDHAATHDHDTGESHGSYGSYLTGFILSVLLTAGAFGLVIAGHLSTTAAVASISVLALVQVLVHVYYFLHLNSSSKQRWNVTAFAFTVAVAAIIIGGTLWVMYNANQNMMPHMNMSPAAAMKMGD